ncbi:MAG: peroxiredoxin [Aphanocapsa feldmannii 277cV]|uniref:thioredoxin-dependent peroxiredoxin n=2 Tax=Aphanocapsa feldmannii TaxID=192050 RepID=A0A524RQ85_9CHRO|nr:MAG: peroxiredoxin [Aphanocapsa feldmannii 277cV]TGH20944.1 MAG: peroxiredoxin [Aphanocapsa feldmannii 277cI]
MAIGIGDTAPDFCLESSSGGSVRLSDLRGKPVVLFFYPKDDTPGCTAEACGFRDEHDRFKQMDAEVLGISADSLDNHRRFAARHGLTTPLLSDPDNQVRKAFGVPNTLFLLPGRVTYVLDTEGVVRLVFNAMLDASGHVREARACLEAMAARP